MQHPNLPAIGCAQSILMRDSFIRDSFTEDALLSVWDQSLLPALSFTASKEACSKEQRTIVREAGPGVATAVSFGPMCQDACDSNTFCSGSFNTKLSLSESHSQVNNNPHNWHVDSSHQPDALFENEHFVCC